MTLETDVQNSEEQDDEEVSYGDLYTSALVNGEIIVTIPTELLEKTMKGIRNHKAKLTFNCKNEGIPVDNSMLSFSDEESGEYEGCSELRITLSRKATVKIKGEIKIPEQLPD